MSVRERLDWLEKNVIDVSTKQYAEQMRAPKFFVEKGVLYMKTGSATYKLEATRVVKKAEWVEWAPPGRTDARI